LEEELQALEGRLQEESSRLELLRKDRRSIEQQIQDLDSSIEKSNLKLVNVKSNKEYKAALKEIEDLKRNKAATEDKAIQVMEEIEELEKRCNEMKATQGESREKFERDKEDILKQINRLSLELKALEKKRMDFRKAVDQELLERYLFLKERKGGQAISPVVGGVCQVCHMGIPPQRFNESIKGHSLLTCPNCNRIIYWGEDEHYQSALNKV
jgi:predicted  nucleic acid-binding Zn-ribbon protein